MSKSACAYSRAAIGIRLDIKDDVVRMRRVSRHAAHSLELIQPESVARSPGDHVVSAGRVAAHAESSSVPDGERSNSCAHTVSCAASSTKSE